MCGREGQDKLGNEITAGQPRKVYFSIEAVTKSAHFSESIGVMTLISMYEISRLNE